MWTDDWLFLDHPKVVQTYTIAGKFEGKQTILFPREGWTHEETFD